MLAWRVPAGGLGGRFTGGLRWSDTYPERLARLLAADAMIALNGGIGTLSEATVAWSALQTESAAAELTFLGSGWPPVLRALADHLVIHARDLAFAIVCTDPTRPGHRPYRYEPAKYRAWLPASSRNSNARPIRALNIE